MKFLNPKNKILIILLIAFLMRFIFFLFASIEEERYISTDSAIYNTLAVNILKNKFYTTSDINSLQMSLTVPPFYPMFLSFFYYLFNYNILIVLFSQTIISVLTAYILYKIGINIFSEKVGLFSALLLTIDPMSIAYSTQIMTETLFTFIFILAIYFFVFAMKKGKIIYLIISGLFFSLSALTRPISLYFFIFIVPFIIYQFRKNLSKLLINSIIFLLIYFLPIGIWIARNYNLTGKTIFATIQDLNLLCFKAASIVAYESNERFDIVRERFGEEYLMDPINEPETYGANVTLARQIILSHPKTYIKLASKSVLQTILGPGKEITYLILGLNNQELRLFDIKQYGPVELLILIIELFILFIIYIGLIFGLYWIIKNKYFLHLIFFAIIMLYFIVLPAGVGVYYRFRVPVMPYIALVSGVGYFHICSILTMRRSGEYLQENGRGY